LQIITYVIPLRHMLTITPGIVLKDVGLEILRQRVIALIVFSVAIMLLAASRFVRRLK
jgi:hypothetical protein